MSRLSLVAWVNDMILECTFCQANWRLCPSFDLLELYIQNEGSARLNVDAFLKTNNRHFELDFVGWELTRTLMWLN